MNLTPQNHNNLQPENPLWFNYLHVFGNRLRRVPRLRGLALLVRKITAVAEPTRKLSYRTHSPKSSVHSGEVVTILSANLWHDWPRFRHQEKRLEQLAQLVEREGVDILLLQEVSRTPYLKVDRWLSQRLKMTSVYSRANGRAAAIGFEEGVAILSHFPLAAACLQQLDGRQNSLVSRLALSADALTPDGRIALFSVHLGLLPHHNVRQLKQLLSWVSILAHDRPALIGGDFNAGENSSQIRQAQQVWLDTYRHLHPQAEGNTHELRAWGKFPLSRRRLDYIFFKSHEANWQIAEAGHLDTPDGSHSDHKAVLLRLKSTANGSGWLV